MHKRLWNIVLAALIVTGLVLALPGPAAADAGDAARKALESLNLTFSAQFSKAVIAPGETFTVTATGSGTLTDDLEFPFNMVSQAKITGNMTARNNATGDTVILYAGYEMELQDLPSLKGETYTAEPVTINCSFPAGSATGTYTVTGVLTRARVFAALSWIDVTAYVPASLANRTLGTINYGTGGSQGGNGGSSGGSSGTSSPSAGTTLLNSLVNAYGFFFSAVTALSGDRLASVAIGSGVRGIDINGKPLTRIDIVPVKDPPEANFETGAAGICYDFGPSGTTFDKPVRITLKYVYDKLPRGVAESSLYIAWYDDSAGKWNGLPSEVDPVKSTVTAEITHFTRFAIFYPLKPAEFIVKNFSLSPAEIGPGEQITLSFQVTNTGDVASSYSTNLIINDTFRDSRTLNLAGGESRTVEFTISEKTAGTYRIRVAGLTGSFTVRDAQATANPDITASATPPAVTTPGTATAAPTGTPTPAAPSSSSSQTPARPISLWLLIPAVVVAAALAAIAVLVIWKVRKRKQD